MPVLRDLPHLPPVLVGQFPIGVIWIVGIVLALRRWRSHPQVSLLILIAFGLELAQAVSGTLVWYWMSVEMHVADHKAYLILFYVRWGLDLLAWIPILVALFRWRRLPSRLIGHDGQYLPEDFVSQGEKRL